MDSSDGAAVYADLNGDRRFTDDERFPFHPLPVKTDYTVDTRGWPISESCFGLALSGKSFRQFPSCVRLFERGKSTYQDKSRSVDLGVGPWVTGTATIGSRKIRVGYSYDLRSDSVNPMDAELGMREESGGPIDFVPGSPQTAVADKESVVFRVGDLYLSTDSVDLKRSSFVLRSHPAADYIRVELVPGAALPDWTFTDLSGVQGSLKSYAGKYVLLDFWTSWCAPCRADFEDLKVVLHRFQSRNFEVLGVLSDTDEAAARKLAQERNLPWPTAASPATLDYAMKRLRVSIFPTHILLDPNGHVVSASDTAVRGEALSKTLEALLPR